MTAHGDKDIERMADLIFTLRQRCSLKDLYFVKKAGISSSEYNCLMQFFQTDSLGMSELAERLSITPAGVTRIVSGLEERGILERRISSEDRRSIDVVLTGSGKKIVDDVRKASMELHAEIMKGIDPAKRKAVMSGLEQLVTAIDKWLSVRNGVEID
jgi:DNA-binding MarR family transcriptional regulator